MAGNDEEIALAWLLLAVSPVTLPSPAVCRLHAVNQRDHRAYRGGSPPGLDRGVAYEPSASRPSPVSGRAGGRASWPTCLRTA